MSVGKIQTVPRGLLQFLGMVGSGVAPTQMGDEVRASFEMLPFYGSAALGSRGFTATMVAAGDNTAITVPAGEAWILVAAQGILVCLVGESARLSIRLGLKDAGNVRVKSSETQTILAASANVMVAHAFEQPIVLTAGNSVSVVAEDLLTAAARTSNVSIAAYIFQL